jgi:hypothetical protein
MALDESRINRQVGCWDQQSRWDALGPHDIQMSKIGHNSPQNFVSWIRHKRQLLFRSSRLVGSYF